MAKKKAEKDVENDTQTTFCIAIQMKNKSKDIVGEKLHLGQFWKASLQWWRKEKGVEAALWKTA